MILLKSFCFKTRDFFHFEVSVQMIEVSIETFLFCIVEAHVRRNEHSILKASSMHTTDGKRNVVFTFNFTFLCPQKSRFVVRFSKFNDLLSTVWRRRCCSSFVIIFSIPRAYVAVVNLQNNKANIRRMCRNQNSRSDLNFFSSRWCESWGISHQSRFLFAFSSFSSRERQGKWVASDAFDASKDV